MGRVWVKHRLLPLLCLVVVVLSGQAQAQHTQISADSVCPNIVIEGDSVRFGSQRIALRVLEPRATRALLLSKVRDRARCVVAIATDADQAQTFVVHIAGAEVTPIARIAAPHPDLAEPLQRRVESMGMSDEDTLTWGIVESRAEACRRAEGVRYVPRRMTYHQSGSSQTQTEDAEGTYVDCQSSRTQIRRPLPPARREVAARSPSPDHSDTARVLHESSVALVSGASSETVRVWSNGRLEVGGHEVGINLALLKNHQYALRVNTRCFDARRNIMWVTASLEDQYEEDSFWRAQAFMMIRGRLVRVLAWERHSAGWMTSERLGPHFRCDGTVRELRVSSVSHDARGRRIRNVEEHPFEEMQVSPLVEDVYRLRGRQLRHDVSFRTGLMHDRRSFAACPHVYVMRDGVYEPNGAILRHLNREDLYGTQRLRLGHVPAGILRIELREEEHEITRLDHVEVVIDGQRYAPLGCEGAYCTQDSDYHVMRQGTVLELRFRVPAGEAHLQASGFYEVFQSKRQTQTQTQAQTQTQTQTQFQ